MIDPDKIKALALDLDGTLLAPGAVLTERAIKAVNGCMQRGLKIIIATGRALESTERFRVTLGAEGPMIYFNGALVTVMPENEVLSTTLLDKKAAEFCLDLSREMSVYCQMFIPGKDSKITLMAEREATGRSMYYNHTGILAELADLKEFLQQAALDGCFKSMFVAEPEILDLLRPRLDEQFGNSVYIARTLRTFLEVMNAKVSKGQGLEVVMEHCSLKKEEVIAFGDEENDIPLLAAAGFSVVPSNAQDTVKARADLVVGSNADDGVAAFLEEFFGL